MYTFLASRLSNPVCLIHVRNKALAIHQGVWQGKEMSPIPVQIRLHQPSSHKLWSTTHTAHKLACNNTESAHGNKLLQLAGQTNTCVAIKKENSGGAGLHVYVMEVVMGRYHMPVSSYGRLSSACHM